MTQAMRAFAKWATARPLRLILLSIVFVQILAPVSAALIVLDALRRGPVAAMTSALLAITGFALISLALGAGLVEALSLSAPVLLASVAIGALLGWSRSLSLTFQCLMVGAVVVSLLLFTVVPGVDQLGDFLLNETLLLLESVGLDQERLTLFGATSGNLLVQFLLTSVLLSLLAALMLGYWWYALLDPSARFGVDFRALKLGRFAGSVLIVLVALRLFVAVEMIQNMAQLAVVGFLFQGLAVMHARGHSDNWHRAIIVLVYVALFSFSPLALMVIVGLTVVGLLDNFFALRARIEPHS